jgi:hypothetical protein
VAKNGGRVPPFFCGGMINNFLLSDGEMMGDDA